MSDDNPLKEIHKENGAKSWDAHRKKVLKEHGLLEEDEQDD